MRCPSDETTLVMTERSGIEIDYCPTCRGVWLDRGELDKIIDRSVQMQAPAAPPAPAAPAAPPSRDYERYDDRRGYDNRGYDNRRYDDKSYKKRKKESWLSELFD